MPTGSIRRRNGPQGTRYQARIPGVPAATFRTRKQAEQWLRETLAKLDAGEYVAPSHETLASYADHWLNTIQVEVSSEKSYRSALRTHILPVFGAMPLGRITTRDIQAFYNTKREARNRHIIHTVLNQIMDQARRERLIRSNPCDDATGMTQPRRREKVRAWDAGMLARFLAEHRDEFLWPMWWVAANTGMRPGELTALRWQDVDLDAAIIHVSRTEKRTTPGHTYGRAKSAASIRQITIDTETVAVLQAHRVRQTERRLAIGDGWQDHDAVFDRGDGQHPSAANVSQIFSRRVVRMGWEATGMHVLRHCHASLLLAAGRPVHYVSRRLGHANPSITLGIYAHLIPGTGYDDAELFAALLRDARVG